MSEASDRLATKHGALSHAGEVAQWVLMLLGWLWLGEQGMRLGWSLASGVLAVSLWWAVRLLCRGSAWALGASPAVMAWCGGLSALGVWLPEALAPLNMAHAGLWVVALLWGGWSGLVETRSRVSTFDFGLLAWHPVLAAFLVGLGWQLSGGGLSAIWGTSLLLALCAAVLHARDRATVVGVPRVCRGQQADLSNVLAPSAMGLMMGGLWLGNVWCAGLGLGWTIQEMVLGHLAMMAVLPTLVAWVGRLLILRTAVTGVSLARHAHLRPYLSLALLALGSLMFWGQSALDDLLAMLLPSLAWAVHCSRPRVVVDFRASPWLLRSMALVLGPGLLLWVGVGSPMQGPLAMKTALALLGTLAVLQGLVMCVRESVVHASWSAP